MTEVEATTDARILIVDDEPANVRLLERILQMAGYSKLHTTTEPRQVADLYAQLQPDLILLDLHMPRLDGLAVLDQLQRLIPAEAFVPVLVLTADATSQAKERALSTGAKDFLLKPFDRVEVLLRIRNLLETRSLHVRLESHNRALQNQLRQQTEQDARRQAERQLHHRRIRAVLDGGGLEMVFQPIVDLRTGQVAGAESLARFAHPPQRTPEVWFAEAATVGLGTELELTAIKAATRRFPELPADAYLSVNASPPTVQSPELSELVARSPAHRLVLEVTEHELVDDYPRLSQALGALRATGIRVAVDDAGAGFASLRHILNLRPDIIKLDIGLTRGVDADPVRRALATALVGFAKEIGAIIVAEGIETSAELATLRSLDVPYGQGFYLARPGGLPLPAVQAATEPTATSVTDRPRFVARSS